ncbi:hypothetical protein HHI36_011039 [Cryptolaemus montrouzieri]|uniref:Uncharacterized protein n=1 Tax=Cryptolaemus montrouzieri TaxID=559131 RepID=A0ABD2MKG9_9CUCU
MLKLRIIFFLLVICLNVKFNGISGAVVENRDSSVTGRGIDAKSIISSLASNFLSRGYFPSAAGAGSQVISLNLTNLLVLVLLKALIFAAGSIGLGHLKEKEYEYYGRNLDSESLPQSHNLVITEDEMLLYLGYLTGNHGCLQNIACHQPDQAKKYADAGEILLRASKLFAIETGDNYDIALKKLERAADIGRNNGDCSVFMCSNNDYT